jgi:small subunit ribosomal protein S15
MALSVQEKANVLENNRISSEDTGSSEVQVAMLTANIFALQKHFKFHSKDFHSRRGLLRMVNKRRRLLSYLKRKNALRYKNLINKLGLRR